MGLLTAAAGAAVFDSRENVNLLNCYNASITSNHPDGARDPDTLRSHADGSWQNSWGGLGVNDPNSYLLIDFGEARNVETVRMAQWNGYQLTAAEVCSSSDGSTFSAPLAHTLTDSSGNAEIVLDAPVDTRYLRITGTGYQNASRRWIVFNMRALGSAGTLDPANNDIDLLSSTGLADGDANPATPTVAMTLNGTVNREGATLEQWVDDAWAPLGRKVIYNLGTGDGFTLAFDQVFEFTKFAFYATPGQNDPNADFTVEVSMDGSDWGTPVLTQTSNPGGLQFYDLIAKEGQYVRFTFTDTSGYSNYINDVMVFGSVPSGEPIPEPASAVLVMAGLGLVLRRRRAGR